MSSNNNQEAFGKLVIKASLGSDIRILPINNEDLTYDELVLMMQRVFKDKLATINTNTDLSIKYKDSAGDLVSVLDTSDLTYAVHESSPLLRLHLLCHPQQRTHCYQIDASSLQSLRDQLHSVLSLLENLSVVPAATFDQQQQPVQQQLPQQLARIQIASPAPAGGSGHQEPPREFDPLSQDSSTKNGSVPSTPSRSASIAESKEGSSATPPVAPASSAPTPSLPLQQQAAASSEAPPTTAPAHQQQFMPYTNNGGGSAPATSGGRAAGAAMHQAVAAAVPAGHVPGYPTNVPMGHPLQYAGYYNAANPSYYYSAMTPPGSYQSYSAPHQQQQQPPTTTYPGYK